MKIGYFWLGLIGSLIAIGSYLLLTSAITARAEGPDHEAEAFSAYDWRITDLPMEFLYNSRYRDAGDPVIEAGVRGWNGYSNFSAAVTGTTTRTATGCNGVADGYSVIDWGRIDRSVVAIACYRHETGECDIRIDPWKYPNLADEWYKGLVTHEVGHCAGLGHSEDPGALMHEWISVTTPQADDITGIRALYSYRYWWRW